MQNGLVMGGQLRSRALRGTKPVARTFTVVGLVRAAGSRRSRRARSSPERSVIALPPNDRCVEVHTENRRRKAPIEPGALNFTGDLSEPFKKRV